MLELKQNAVAVRLLQLVKNNPIVTLVYAARDEQHNQAVVLKQFIDNGLPE